MKYSYKHRIGLEDVGLGNLATNKALITLMEEVSGFHSTEVGFGLLDTDRMKKGWVLLDWQIKVIKRPVYADVVTAVTWSRGTDKLRAFRDFKIEDDRGNVIAIGTSSWVFMDIEKRRPVRIEEDMLNAYESESEMVFPNKMESISVPNAFIEAKKAKENGSEQNSLETNIYKVTRKDIDMNEHMHNISYIDVANEILPENIYDNPNYNCLRITYKKEAKYGQEISCFYAEENDCHFVVMNSDKGVHAIVELGIDIF